MIYVVK